MKIAAFSAFCVDYFTINNVFRPGGNSFNFAIHTKQMGAEQSSAVGFLGKDKAAKLVLDLLKKNEVDISHLYQKTGQTASNKIHNTPEGERYSNPGDWNGGVMDTFEISEETWEFILSHDIWAIPCLDRNLEKAIKLKSKKHKMVVDFLHIDSIDFISQYLDSLDIAFVSTQIEKLENLKKLSASSKKLIVATMGADGSIAFNSGEAFYQKAIPVKKVVDTTGCGDTFQAAFTYTYFNTGMIDKALLAGATEAEKIIHSYGGVLYED